MIDLVNKNNEEACFLFLDQEKAFDRVNHSFLFKVLQQFGFGESFPVGAACSTRPDPPLKKVLEKGGARVEIIYKQLVAGAKQVCVH